MVNKCEVMGRQTLNEKKKTSNYAGENESRVITANEVTLPRVHPPASAHPSARSLFTQPMLQILRISLCRHPPRRVTWEGFPRE